MTSPLGLLGLEPADPEPRQCLICQRWYKISNPRLMCAVIHGPGTCCHYGDTEVPAPEASDPALDPDSEPTGEELRARYCGQLEGAEAAKVIAMLGRDDLSPDQVWASRYSTLEAFEAFADGNKRHHGHETLGPVDGGDGWLYGLIIFRIPDGHQEAVDKMRSLGNPSC